MLRTLTLLPLGSVTVTSFRDRRSVGDWKMILLPESRFSVALPGTDIDGLSASFTNWSAPKTIPTTPTAIPTTIRIAPAQIKPDGGFCLAGEGAAMRSSIGVRRGANL